MSTPYEMMERIERLEAALVKVVAERDALRADAARYRWLRENGRMGYIWNAALHEHEKEGRWDVDAVIDAERGAQS